MQKDKERLLQIVGVVGTVISVWLYVRRPSFPTPDKLLIFLVFSFMIFKQGYALLKRLLPFVVVLLVYESFRSVADQLNHHVNYSLAPHIDRLIFGNLPTIYLQNWLWRGHSSWYDYLLYLPYLLHFILPMALAILIWKTKSRYYWQVVTTYLVVAFGAFLTFLLLPAAPPWLASQNHYIEPIIRISSAVWRGLGLQNFPSFYNEITPNVVASIPSLHAAWAMLLPLFVHKFYSWRWTLLSATYPLVIFLGTVYEGEHYAFDILTGIAYGYIGYKVTPYLMQKLTAIWRRRLKPKVSLKARHLLK